MPTWPVTIPQAPEFTGYQGAFGENAIRSQPDAGPVKARRRYTATNDPRTWQFVLKAAEFATFKTFYQTTLLDGTLAFDMTDPESGGAANFRFTTSPTWILLGPSTYRVTAQLVKLP